jgi:predicted nicotinamide N-methyase
MKCRHPRLSYYHYCIVVAILGCSYCWEQTTGHGTGNTLSFSSRSGSGAFIRHQHVSQQAYTSNGNNNGAVLLTTQLDGKRGGGGVSSDGKKQKSRGRKGNKRNNSHSQEEDVVHAESKNDEARTTANTAAIVYPSKTKRLQLSFPALSQSLSQVQATAVSTEGGDLPAAVVDVGKTVISIVEVQDNAWWETTENPYGGRTWPSSLGIAQFLWKHQHQLVKHAYTGTTTCTIIEVACGNGLPSLVAASMGATVVATDISRVTLKLVNDGWKDCRPKRGSLTTKIFDLGQDNLSSLLPRPRGNSNTNNDESSGNTSTNHIQMLIASAALYEPDLAKALGRCVVQAYQKGMWIIVGDCDTGERDGGRAIFLKILEEHNIDTHWVEQSMAHPQLGWKGKPIKLIHMNVPDHIDLQLE